MTFRGNEGVAIHVQWIVRRFYEPFELSERHSACLS
jgi:hypothetical protein